jgi:MerR family transcriptional regulator, heat shock protein HspR
MDKPRYQIVPCRVEREQVTLEVLAASAGLHPTLVECFIEYGLIEPDERAGAHMLFNVACITRLRMIQRLRHDVGVNLSGIGVILNMLDRLTALQRENAWLRNQQ